MDAQELFAASVSVIMFGLIIIALLGGDISALIDIVPEVIIFLFVVAIVIAVINSM